MLALHSFAENELLAPALLWARLARHWGNSFLGLGPKYMDYMQSDSPAMDKAFNDSSNDELNHIIGYSKNETIKQRFERAVAFYEYCCIRNKETSINWPFDSAPDIESLVSWRKSLDTTLPPSALPEAATAILSPEQMAIFNFGLNLKQSTRSQQYSDKVKESLDYVRSEVQSRMTLSLNELNKEGWLEGNVPSGLDFDVDDMDEALPQETQEKMLGDTYKAGVIVLQPGVILNYLNAAQNVQMQMYTPEREREFTSTFDLLLRSWQQLLQLTEA